MSVEQGVAVELQQDGRDATALQLVAIDGEAVIGTCRVLTDQDTWRLGRMAVRADRRADGVGRGLVDLAHREARAAGPTACRRRHRSWCRDLRAGVHFPG